jgi:hypothetical protein
MARKLPEARALIHSTSVPRSGFILSLGILRDGPRMHENREPPRALIRERVPFSELNDPTAVEHCNIISAA